MLNCLQCPQKPSVIDAQKSACVEEELESVLDTNFSCSERRFYAQ